MLLFDLEIPDKPVKDSSFNQCLWQLKKDNGIMGKFTELLTNSDWKSSRCTMEWKAEYVKKNRYILLLHINKIETFGLLPTPKKLEAPSASWENRNPESKYKPGVTLTDLKVWGLLPTPESFDWNSARHPELWEKDKKKYSEKGINLHCNLRQQARLGMLPTPTLQDSRIGMNNLGGSEHRRQRGSIALADVALGLDNPDKSNGNMQLNPQFVLEMMGFPIDFTEKPFQNLE
jgi:hypothetical protein